MRLKQRLFAGIAYLFRKISSMVRRMPFLTLLIIFFASPIGPHLLFSYEYRGPKGDIFSYRSYTRCTYLGSRGFVDAPLTPDCPWIAFIDSRKSAQGGKD